MAAKDFYPGEVINLESSEDEVSPVSKKRSLEDAEGSDPSGDESYLAPGSKRLKTGLPPTAGSRVHTKTEQHGEGISHGAEREISIKEGSHNPELSKPSSTQSSTPGESAPGESTEIPNYRHGSLSFIVPNLAHKKDGSWLNRFEDWVRVFHTLNSDQSHAVTPSLAQTVYAHYIEHHAGLKPKKRRSAKQVSKELESTGALTALLESLQTTGPALDGAVKQPHKATSQKSKSSRASSISEGEIAEEADGHDSDSDVEYEPSLSKNERRTTTSRQTSLKDYGFQANAGPSSRSAPNGDQTPIMPINTTRNVPTGSEALEQQRRYFPSASDSTQMCLLCGRNTHLALNCPTLICSFCGSLEHGDICCPSRQRCDKCSQLGHQAAQCTEKLRLAEEEGLICAYCDSADHHERHCIQVCRSFWPDASTIRKVVFLSASCSLCGSDRHFSTDCKSRRDAVSNPTWSIENRDQYIDPECGLMAIEESTRGPQSARTTRAPELKIRGHAARTTNVHYSESDDSEVEFLGHRPVKQRASLGQIRMASNIQMPASANTQN
ncbi:hypothetical protein FZEAL_10682, partial [Fusarium zealandicum]